MNSRVSGLFAMSPKLGSSPEPPKSACMYVESIEARSPFVVVSSLIEPKFGYS